MRTFLTFIAFYFEKYIVLLLLYTIKIYITFISHLKTNICKKLKISGVYSFSLSSCPPNPPWIGHIRKICRGGRMLIFIVISRSKSNFSIFFLIFKFYFKKLSGIVPLIEDCCLPYPVGEFLVPSLLEILKWNN